MALTDDLVESYWTTDVALTDYVALTNDMALTDDVERCC